MKCSSCYKDVELTIPVSKGDFFEFLSGKSFCIDCILLYREVKEE